MVLLESEKVQLGRKAPNFSLEGTDGFIYKLSDFNEKNILVVIFMCNHCPYVQAIWRRLVALQERFKEKGVQLVGINPNLNPDYPEESMENMKNYYKDYDMNFPYLLDESQDIARAYGAVCTPDIFVYNQERILKYHGRIDDNWQSPSDVTKEEIKEVIEQLLNDKEPSDIQNPSIGCSIKWRN